MILPDLKPCYPELSNIEASAQLLFMRLAQHLGLLWLEPTRGCQVGLLGFASATNVAPRAAHRMPKVDSYNHS